MEALCLKGWSRCGSVCSVRLTVENVNGKLKINVNVLATKDR
jgi:hypothetical protein